MKALAMANRSFEGRPIQPRPQGTKRASGIIPKAATRRLAGPVNFPKFVLQGGEKAGLKDVGKLRDLLPEVKLPRGLWCRAAWLTATA
jgi:hypothetical protein